jgi:hypothetical protein
VTEVLAVAALGVAALAILAVAFFAAKAISLTASNARLEVQLDDATDRADAYAAAYDAAVLQMREVALGAVDARDVDVPHVERLLRDLRAKRAEAPAPGASPAAPGPATAA